MSGFSVFQEQISLLKKLNTCVNNIKDHTISLRVEIERINDCWVDKSVAKKRIINKLNETGLNLMKVYGNFNNFSSNAQWLLNKMSGFEEIQGNVISSIMNTAFEAVGNVNTTNALVKMNTVTLLDCGECLINISNKIENERLAFSKFISSADSKVIAMIRGGRSTFNKANNNINTCKDDIKKIGEIVKCISNFYSTADDNVNKFVSETWNADPLTSNAKKIANVDGIKSNGAKYYIPQFSRFSISKEVGELAKSEIKGKDGVLKWIQSRNDSLPRKSEYASGYCTKYTLDKIRSCGIDMKTKYDNGGNGNKWYQNIKNGENSLPQGYSSDCVDGNNALYTLINKNGGKPIYNIVISFEHAYTQQYYNCGHVLMIDAIIDGQVYFSDNYNNKANSMSLSCFMEYYNSNYGNMLGAAHIIEKK